MWGVLERETCIDDLGGTWWAYSTTPAEFITMSTEPSSDFILAITSAIAVSSRTSTL